MLNQFKSGVAAATAAAALFSMGATLSTSVQARALRGRQQLQGHVRLQDSAQ
jgi:hypothetical protein